MKEKERLKQFEESLASTIRAIGGDDKIKVNFNSPEIDLMKIGQEGLNSHQIELPEIALDDEKSQQNARSFADINAFYLAFHNVPTHQELRQNSSNLELFDNFEKFRLIRLGCQNFRGAAIHLEDTLLQNLDHDFLPLLLLDREQFGQLNRAISPYKKSLDKTLLDKIEKLSHLAENQEEFGRFSEEIIKYLQELVQKNEQESKEDKPKENNEENFDESQEESSGRENKQQNISAPGANDAEDSSPQIPQKIAPSAPAKLAPKKARKQIEFRQKYQIFSKEFDEIIRAEKLADKKEREKLAQELSEKSAKLEPISRGALQKFKRKLLAQKNISRQTNLEEGRIDPKQITRIITDAKAQDFYFQEMHNQFENTSLTILLDNSGSMRGKPITISALVAGQIGEILENFGINIEILGFTTIDWRGGKAKKKWERDGKMANPGRLSDLRHIIYKEFGVNLRRAKKNLALMLKGGLLKENIDGEALLWAASRLSCRKEKRQILLVISDGNPIDDATNSANDHDILSDHLHFVINHLQKHSKIEISAIGIGHDVGRFYANSTVIRDASDLGDVMLEKIGRLL